MTTTSGELPADAIDEDFVPRRTAHASYVELDGEFVIALERPGTGHFDAHWLDRTAAIVWSSFDGATPLRQLIDELGAAFGAHRDVVRDDVMHLARTLGRAGLLEGVAYEPPTPVMPSRPEACRSAHPCRRSSSRTSPATSSRPRRSSDARACSSTGA
jgi:hypothetical protein